MQWVTIAEAKSVEEFEKTIPTIKELPKGTKARIIVEGWGLGPIADLWFAEGITQWIIGSGATVIDVWGEGWSKATIEVEADSIIVTLLIAGVVLFFSAQAITNIIYAIRIDAEKIPEIKKYETYKWIAIGVAAVAGVGLLVVSRR